MKLSLNIGLNRLYAPAYGGFEGWLNACENDATALAALAASRGYVSVGKLTGQATRTEFQAAMGAVIEQLKAGDSFFLSFSGHGGQVPAYTEADGYDETLCFYDGQIKDTELRNMLAAIAPGVSVLVVLDSCHSGGMDRALESTRRPRCLPLRTRKAIAGQMSRSERRQQTIAAGVVILTACAESETASDGAEFGEWTHSLLEAWETFGDYAKFSIGDWFHTSAARCTGQTPQIKILGPDITAQIALA